MAPELDLGSGVHIQIQPYTSDSQLPRIIQLIEADLSEPYTIYTYRYFIHQYPRLCFLARKTPKSNHNLHENIEHPEDIVGVIICKFDSQKERGYIGMLAIEPPYRKFGLGSLLVQTACQEMHKMNALEVVLETELCNTGAQRLYERLGFIRDKRLVKYYQNGQDAFRLKLWMTPNHTENDFPSNAASSSRE